MLQINILFTLEILSMIIKRYSIPIETNIPLYAKKIPTLIFKEKKTKKGLLLIRLKNVFSYSFTNFDGIWGLIILIND